MMRKLINNCRNSSLNNKEKASRMRYQRIQISKFFKELDLKKSEKV